MPIPPGTGRPISGDENYNVLPETINGNPPNLPVGTKLNGVPLSTGGGGGLVFEIPTGVINGSNSVFTTVNDFIDIAVYLNGLRLRGGGFDYTVTDTNEFTLVEPPITGDSLAVEYMTE